MPSPSCTLCLSTYNWPAALGLCLKTILQQEKLPDEIIIADDGSTASTKDVITAFINDCPVPVKHIWQPDEGFQLARIRNKAFAEATGDYIIQIDSDLLLHPHFIADHLHFARANCFVSGTRALLDETITNSFLNQNDFFFPAFTSSHLQKKHNALHSPLLAGMNYSLQRGANGYKYVLGCNMAFWKKDLEKVNGYNEDFTGWGKEDNDIAVRLLNAGIQLRFLKFGGIVYHLHHKQAGTQQVPVNEELFEKSILNKVTYIRSGMQQYASSNKH